MLDGCPMFEGEDGSTSRRYYYQCRGSELPAAQAYSSLSGRCSVCGTFVTLLGRGNFEVAAHCNLQASQAQLEALRRLVDYYKERYGFRTDTEAMQRIVSELDAWNERFNRT